MEDKKMKYHITITDNETGKTEEYNACVFIGAIGDDEGVIGMRRMACGAEPLVHTMNAVEHEIETLKRDHPELVPLQAMLALIDELAVEDDEDDEETEDK